MERGLGRLILEDDRDKGYPMSAVVPTRLDVLPSTRYWWTGGWWGDQGAKPWCVAYAWLHYLADGPITRRPAPLKPPHALYCRAQTLDPWPGDCTNPRYDGTSVRAGAKALQAVGLLETYHWAFTFEDVLRAVLGRGPVVVGTSWFSDMTSPRKDHVLRPSGRHEGGHAYVLNGADMNRKRFRMKNSWGRQWANRGHAWITFDDFHSLLADRGEAVVGRTDG
jgi:hypothetical protein